MHGEMQGKYYRYCSRSIRYSTDLNSENNKFDMETFDLVSEYCSLAYGCQTLLMLGVKWIYIQELRYREVPLMLEIPPA